MKKLQLKLFYAFISFSLIAQNEVKTVSSDGAKMTFESTVMDYGTIKHKTNGDRTFKFINDGTQPLLISNCRGSCGCTVPKCPTEPIMPGESGTIDVSYDTKRIGKFTKTITVNNNTGSPTMLTIKGEVLGPKPLPNAPEKDNSGMPVENPKKR